METALLLFLLLSSFIFLIVMTKLYIDSVHLLNSESMKTLLDSLTKLEIDHFQSIEKINTKHLALLEKQTKESRTHIEKLEKMFLVPEEKTYAKTKNDIAEKPDGEIPMTENMRIPITDMTKIKFEDEETIL